MEYLTVKNWEEFQHYKTRNPPWIKLHRAILDDYEFCRLPDESKAHLMLIWVLASQSNGRIPGDVEHLSRKLGLTTTLNLSLLIEKGFLASTVQARRKQVAIPSREEKRRVDKSSLAAPSDEHNYLAQTLGVSVEAEWSKFTDYCKAKGKVYRDAEAAFRNWLRNAAQYAKRDGTVVPLPNQPKRVAL